MPSKQWRCFYCDEVFRSATQAQIHFGSSAYGKDSTPACQLTRTEGRLVDYIRKLEAEINLHREEGTGVLLAAYSLQMEARALVPDAEQRGYDKGVSETFDMLRKEGRLIEDAGVHQTEEKS